MTEMMEKLIELYRKMDVRLRRVSVFIIAASLFIGTMSLMTFPATAVSRNEGEDIPGFVFGEKESSEPAEEEENPEETEEGPSDEKETIDPQAETTEEPAVVEEEPQLTDGEAGTEEEPAAVEETVAEEKEEEPEEESDPDADVETAADWEELFRDVELTGVWADDLLELAELQIGYRESKKNFILDEDHEKHGYTRYGAWYGDPYADWNSLFILFNLYYTGITVDQFPYKADPAKWVEELKENELFAEAEEYIPVKGDLVFADTDDDDEADYAAIVKEVEYKDGRPDKLTVIEGDAGNEVKKSTYEFYDPSILGFAKLPENPDLAEEEKELAVYTLTGSANRVDVTVEYEEGALPEGTTMEVKTVGDRSVIDAISDTVNNEENKAVVRVQAVDIIFRDSDGNEVEPAKPVKVTMKSNSVPQKAEEKPVIVHVDDQDGPKVVETSPEETKKEEVKFEAESFSVYAIVYTLETVYKTYDGESYKITVGYTAEAKLPEDAALSVNELLPENAGYGDYLLASRAALELEDAAEVNARVFDISIVNGEGEKIEPKAPVQTEIRLLNQDGEETPSFGVVHFGDETEVLETETIRDADALVITFETDGFSIYTVVDLPASTDHSGDTLGLDGKSYAIVFPYGNGNNANTAAMAEQINAGNQERLKAQEVPSLVGNTYSSADIDITNWTFEYAGSANLYYVYAIVNGQKKYIQIDTGDGDQPVHLVDEANKAKLFVEQRGDSYLISDENRRKSLNNLGGWPANGIGATKYGSGADGGWNSSLLKLCSYDPTSLAGQKFAIVDDTGHGDENRHASLCGWNWRDDVYYDGKQAIRLSARNLNPDAVGTDDTGRTFTKGTDYFISEWTFTPVPGKADTYYLQQDDGKYLWADYNGNLDRGVGLKISDTDKTEWKVEKEQGNGSYKIYVAPGQGQNENIYLDLPGGGEENGFSLWKNSHGFWLCRRDDQPQIDLDGAEFAIVSTNNQSALVINGGNVGSDPRKIIDLDTRTVVDDGQGITTWKFIRNGAGYLLSPQINGETKYLKFNGNDQPMTLVDNASDASTMDVILLANGCVAIGGVKVGNDTLYLSQWHNEEIKTQNHPLRADADIFNVNDKNSCSSFLLCTPVKGDLEDHYIFNTYGSAYANAEAVPINKDDPNGPRTAASLEGNKGDDALNGDFYYLWNVDDDPTNKVKYLYSGDAHQWTLESLGNDEYILSTNDDGYRKFLRIDNNYAHLSDAKEYYQSNNKDAYKVKIVFDDSANRYTISKTIDGTDYYLTLDHLTSGSGTEAYWDYQFRGKTEITGKDARLQQFVFAEKGRNKEQEKTATKVSVQSLASGNTVIPYYVVTDSTTKKEKYYAIDKNGEPFEVTNSGSKIAYNNNDPIEWTFSKQDDVHYQFINADGNSLLPTSSTQSPLITTGASGAVLPGRQDGKYTSKIANYDQSDGQDVWYAVGYDPTEGFISVPMDDSRAVEMRFASVDTDSSTVKEVATVDSVAKGIKMSMFDYFKEEGEDAYWNRINILQNAFGTTWTSGPGTARILKNKLGDDGYPVTNDVQIEYGSNPGERQGGTTGNHSISNLFDDAYLKGERDKANHLFLQSEYDATGYYHYRSWENYAAYNTNTSEFTVYDAVGTPADNDHHAAYSHGNFMPYNDLYDENHQLLKASDYNYFMFDNEGLQLPVSDPRLADNLYLIPDKHDNFNVSPDYFFGMTMEVPFSQPKNGLVDGTKNMTFEFNGDDDMWVYVDGVLLLDIGGIHDPRSGWIDFTTGVIYEQDGGTSSIRAKFAAAGYTEAQLNEIFVPNADGTGYRFKDYSNHKLNMYYFERGAGASNLDIRFNLITRSENEFEVTKTLSNNEDPGVKYQEPYGDQTFKFNAYVHRGEDGKGDLTKYTKLTSAVNSASGQHVEPDPASDPDEIITAWIKGTNPKQKVTFNADGTFNLKAGQSVVFHVEDKNQTAAPWYYYIEEVDVDADYDLKINNESAIWVPEHPGTYRCNPIAMDDTATAEADNTPKQLAELKLTKEIDRNIYDADGRPTGRLLPEDVLPTEYFDFKIELENPDYDPTQTGSQQYKPYLGGDYYVMKDDHYYIHNGTTMEDKGTTKTPAGKTSPYGDIYNIPAGYTIIVEGLLPGTKFKVTEVTSDSDQHYYTWENYYLDKGTDHEVKQYTSVGEGITGTITTVTPVTNPVTFINNNVTTTNMPKVRDIILEKEDNEGNPLEGATFELWYVTATGEKRWKTDIKPVMVDGKAQVKLESLPHGRVYKLVETKAPDGHIIKTREFYFKVEYETRNEEVVEVVKLCDQTGNEKTYDGIKLSTIGDKITLKVENTPGTPLPMTGGTGTTVFTALGMILIAGAGFLLWRRRPI